MTQPALKGLLGNERGDLLDTLYDAPQDPDAWPRFLAQAVQATRSRSARMLVLDRRAQTVLSSIKHNIGDSDHQAYVDHYVNACPWRPELQDKPAGQLYSTFLDFSCRQKAFYSTEFYNDWARQQDIHHGVCGTVWQDEDHTVQLLIQRTRQQGHYTREETEQINELVLHVRRAVRLQTQFTAMDQQRQALQQTLDIQAQPFALLDAQGTIIHISQEAEQLAATHPRMSIKQRRLTLQDPRQQNEWLQLLTQVTHPNPALRGSGGVIAIPLNGTLMTRCLISPLSPGAAPTRFNTQQAPLAITYFQDPLSDIDIDLTSLMQLFELSEAEARVAAGIAQGLSPQQIADSHFLSVHTVRTQLKSTFQKTATMRQAELAKLVLTSPAARRWRRPPLTLSCSA
ncbi:helix-turn-helix transcriptional regulator [Alcanivorax sp.]|uniref:helix-turn-helix transcriptional regulator n=1 Tax=Alcanivorax sp. TaxID=1872427 RepID=UPI003A95CAA6